MLGNGVCPAFSSNMKTVRVVTNCCVVWGCHKLRGAACKFWLLEEHEELRKAKILRIRGDETYNVIEGKEQDSVASTSEFKSMYSQILGRVYR